MTCPGCGLEGDHAGVPFPAYIGTTSRCWKLYSETLALLSGDHWDSGVNRLMVDAYAAQHPGPPGRQADQSVAVHLVGLHLMLEVRLPPDRTTRTLDGLLRKMRQYPRLERARSAGELTIADFAGLSKPDDAEVLAERWARAVWDSYSDHHATVRTFAGIALRDKLPGAL